MSRRPPPRSSVPAPLVLAPVPTSVPKTKMDLGGGGGGRSGLVDFSRGVLPMHLPTIGRPIPIRGGLPIMVVKPAEVKRYVSQSGGRGFDPSKKVDAPVVQSTPLPTLPIQQPIPLPQPTTAAPIATSKVTVTSRVAVSSSSMWTEKYRPQTGTDVFGNPKAMQDLKQFVKGRKDNPGTKGVQFVVATLLGPPGVGKTSAAVAVLKDHGFQVVHINGSDERTKGAVYFNIKESVTRKSLRKPLSIVVDEIDGAVHNVGGDDSEKKMGEESNSGVNGVLQFIQECKTGVWTCVGPIICICNDTSSKVIRNLLKESWSIKFWPPFPSVLKQVLGKVCRLEGLKLNVAQQENIVEAARGDVRRLLHLLQTTALDGDSYSAIENGTSDEFDDIFAATRNLIYSHANLSTEEIDRLVSRDASLIPLMVHENMPSLFATGGDGGKHTPQDMNEMAQFLDDLSIVDVMDTYNYRQPSAPVNHSALLGHSTRLHGAPFRSRVRDVRRAPLQFTKFFEHRVPRQEKRTSSVALNVGVTEVDLAAHIWHHTGFSEADRTLAADCDEMFKEAVARMAPRSEARGRGGRPAKEKKRKKNG